MIKSTSKSSPPPIVPRWVTDPVELEKSRVQDERFERNWRWFEAHAAEIYPRYRGMCFFIAGQELFVADTALEAIALAAAAHPEDDGRFTQYVSREQTIRIYCAVDHKERGVGFRPERRSASPGRRSGVKRRTAGLGSCARRDCRPVRSVRHECGGNRDHSQKTPRHDEPALRAGRVNRMKHPGLRSVVSLRTFGLGWRNRPFRPKAKNADSSR
jgi:hypothetical protein